VTSVPALPFEKLIAYRLQCVELGKEYKENVARSAIDGLWEEKGGDPSLLLGQVESPEYFEQNSVRARAIRMDDRSAKAELEKAQLDARKQIATRNSAVLEGEFKDSKIAELERQLAEARGKATKAPEKTATPPKSPSATPDATWGRNELIAYGNAHGLTLPKNLVGASKNEVLEAILQQENKPDEALIG
jgi:hypothetical protein